MQNRFEEGLQFSSLALELSPDYVRCRERRATLYERLDRLDEALADLERVAELTAGAQDAHHWEAVRHTAELKARIADRNERLKAEMVDKLKQLGNLVLRPFGLSTDNFQLKQDPNSGGYSVQFVNSSGARASGPTNGQPHQTNS